MFPGVEVLEIFRLERERYSAQDTKESEQHIPQQTKCEIPTLCNHCGWINRCDYSNPSADCFEDIETY
jgi:hypothetical protein